jgi:hypothetical protein
MLMPPFSLPLPIDADAISRQLLPPLLIFHAAAVAIIAAIFAFIPDDIAGAFTFFIISRRRCAPARAAR